MDFPQEPIIKKPRLNVSLLEDNDTIFGGITLSGVPILSGLSAKNLPASESREVITSEVESLALDGINVNVFYISVYYNR